MTTLDVCPAPVADDARRPTSPLRSCFPLGLTLLRVALAPVLVFAAWQAWRGPAFVVLLTAGLLSDVYDGVLARRWDVATAALRRLDSAADVVFYAAVLVAAHHVHPAAIDRWRWAIAGLALLEAAVQVTCLVRWRSVQATHSFLAKLWGLTLWVAFAALLGFGVATSVPVALAVGYAADAEVLAILLLSPTVPVDVRSAAAAWRLRRSASVLKKE